MGVIWIPLEFLHDCFASVVWIDLVKCFSLHLKMGGKKSMDGVSRLPAV